MTPKQLAFVAAFILMHNATRAATAAGFSARTAAAAGSRLRKHPEVAAAIERLRGVNKLAGCATPLDYLMSVVHDEYATTPRRIRAAMAAARYIHPRPSSGGKKDQQQVAAKAAGTGKFAAAGPPLRLVPRGRDDA